MTDTESNTPDTDQPLLEIEDLAVSFPGPGGKRVQAVDGMRAAIYPRQTLAVVGESGSGKSVTAMSVLQLIPVPPGRYDGGRILWRGGKNPESATDLLRLDDRRMRQIRGNQIAMIFQEPMTSLNPVYTIGEQILEAILLHQQVTRSEARTIATRALDDVGIADPEQRLNEYPHQLSGGMRQRVMIAMALACQPRLLLADEPTTALDVTIQAQILELLRELQRTQHMAMMLITHDLGVVAENADVVAVMYAGRVCEYASVQDIFNRPLHPYTRGLLKSMPVLGHRADRLPTVRDGATIPEDFPSSYTVAPHDPDPDPTGGYGGPNARLHEVESDHWVLCTPKDADAPAPRFPRLAFRRPSAVAAT
ncbi:MAG: ATP-binding cassette domain-containing protein [Phycisphaeraceae bacterium]